MVSLLRLLAHQVSKLLFFGIILVIGCIIALLFHMIPHKLVLFSFFQKQDFSPEHILFHEVYFAGSVLVGALFGQAMYKFVIIVYRNAF